MCLEAKLLNQLGRREEAELDFYAQSSCWQTTLTCDDPSRALGATATWPFISLLHSLGRIVSSSARAKPQAGPPQAQTANRKPQTASERPARTKARARTRLKRTRTRLKRNQAHLSRAPDPYSFHIGFCAGRSAPLGRQLSPAGAAMKNLRAFIVSRRPDGRKMSLYCIQRRSQ